MGNQQHKTIASVVLLKLNIGKDGMVQLWLDHKRILMRFTERSIGYLKAGTEHLEKGVKVKQK